MPFRQAIAYATDRRTIIDNILLGLGELQNSMVPENTPFYLSPEQGLKVYNYDPDKAKELLLEQDSNITTGINCSMHKATVSALHC